MIEHVTVSEVGSDLGKQTEMVEYEALDCGEEEVLSLQMDGIAKARERGLRFGRKCQLTPKRIDETRTLREAGTTVPDIIRQIIEP